MKGTLKNTPAGWFVWYSVMRDEITSGYESLQLHPDDVKQIQEDSQRFDNIEARIAAYPDVEFEIVKEYIDSHSNQVQAYAKLIATYPELEGTMALCEDMIEAAAQQSVPAPDELQQELRRVRSAKNAHVKAQNWELAAAYREIEKLLQKAEPKCANCQYMLSATGVGQGLICELNKCRIPHSEHSCQYHWYGVTQSAESASFDSENIEQLAWDNPCLSRHDVYELFEEVFKEKKMRGPGFDVSASKEVRQFKHRLRELAKQRYEQHCKHKQC